MTYFIVTNSNIDVGIGLSSVDYDTGGCAVGVGTTFILIMCTEWLIAH